MLTAAELTQFHEEGYVVKPDVYSARDLQPLKDAITEIIHREACRLRDAGELDEIFESETFERRLARIRSHNEAAGTAIYQAILGRGGGGFHGPQMLDIIRHDGLLSCIESIIGPEIVGSAVYRIRPKMPHFDHGEVPWHQDSGYLLRHCDTQLVVTCWVPLVDATVANGCIYVYPRVHRTGIIEHFTGGHAGFLEIPTDLFPAGSAPIPIEMRAGSALLMTNLTPHASFENATDEVRWSIDLRYQSPDVPNNVGEEPEDYAVERDPVTMACYPFESDFVIRDPEHPEREVTRPETFEALRRKYETTTVKMLRPPTAWKPLAERQV